MFCESKTFRLALIVMLPIIAAVVMAEITLVIIELQQSKSVRDYGNVIGRKKPW